MKNIIKVDYKEQNSIPLIDYTTDLEELAKLADTYLGKKIIFTDNHHWRTEDIIILKNTKCPFGEKVRKAPSLCATTSALCGVMTARNLGYSRVILKKTIAKGSNECLIHIHLKKTESKDKETDEYASV